MRGEHIVKAITHDVAVQSDEIEDFGIINEVEPDEFSYTVKQIAWQVILIIGYENPKANSF